MGTTTAIPWCDHTFNPWWGCRKVSPGCANCYAETFANRFGQWFGDNPRRFFGAKHWAEPYGWDRAAKRDGVRRRVFCGSMCDVFEDREGLNDVRMQLWRLIYNTPHLDWLLLTKRPENVKRLCHWAVTSDLCPNVWLGVTAENQEMADERIPILLEIPAAQRFVSIEPMLGPILLDNGSSSWLSCDGHKIDANDQHCCESHDVSGEHFHGIDWIICGDESGRKRRPAQLDWVRSIRDQCVDADVPFFFKQWHLDGVKIECPTLSAVAGGIVLEHRQWMEFPG